MYECSRHIFCAYHNRWEGPRHGYIRCDEASYRLDLASYQRAERPPTPTWDTGVDPAAYFGWRGWVQQAPDDVMDWDTTAPEDDDGRKPPAPADNDDRKPPATDDYDEDCFTIKLAWQDSVTK